MGDKSPKDKNKRRKQQERQVSDLNRARAEKQQRGDGGGQNTADPNRKAG